MKVRKGQVSIRIPKRVYQIIRVGVKTSLRDLSMLYAAPGTSLRDLPKQLGTPYYYIINTDTKRLHFYPLPDRAMEIVVTYLPQPEEF